MFVSEDAVSQVIIPNKYARVDIYLPELSFFLNPDMDCISGFGARPVDQTSKPNGTVYKLIIDVGYER